MACFISALAFGELNRPAPPQLRTRRCQAWAALNVRFQDRLMGRAMPKMGATHPPGPKRPIARAARNRTLRTRQGSAAAA